MSTPPPLHALQNISKECMRNSKSAPKCWRCLYSSRNGAPSGERCVVNVVKWLMASNRWVPSLPPPSFNAFRLGTPMAGKRRCDWLTSLSSAERRWRVCRAWCGGIACGMSPSMRLAGEASCCCHSCCCWSHTKPSPKKWSTVTGQDRVKNKKKTLEWESSALKKKTRKT